MGGINEVGDVSVCKHWLVSSHQLPQGVASDKDHRNTGSLQHLRGACPDYPPDRPEVIIGFNISSRS